MRELHLFAGIGGGILGGELLGHRCVGAVEIEPYCRQVLERKQLDGTLPTFPIHDDVRTFDGFPWRGRVDVVCGGFPCQPWSPAGDRGQTEDPRHLWPEMFRIVRECRPRYVFAENVAFAAFEQPYHDLRGLGFRIAPLLALSAGDVGAPFRRKRFWLLAADPHQDRQPDGSEHAKVEGEPDPSYADCKGLEVWEGQFGHACAELAPVVGATWRAAAPRLHRLVSRLPGRVDSRTARIRAAGNAQVPAVAATAFQILHHQLTH